MSSFRARIVFSIFSFLILSPMVLAQNKKVCEPKQFLLVQSSDDKSWNLFFCDKEGVPWGLTKSQIADLYNKTKNDKSVNWGAFVGSENGKEPYAMIRDYSPYDVYPWNDKNKKNLMDFANLFREKSEDPVFKSAKIIEADSKKLSEYQSAMNKKVTSQCSKMMMGSGGRATKVSVSADGMANCLCGKQAFINFDDWECDNQGKLNALAGGSSSLGAQGNTPTSAR